MSTQGTFGAIGAVMAVLVFATFTSADQPRCGPGTVKVKNQCLPDYDYICGDGTQLVGDQCLPAPKQAVCGDGVVDPGEVCDDGNTVDEIACPYGTPSCTACSSDCQQVLALTGAYCGDGIVQGLEQCDAGSCGSTSCTTECQPGETFCYQTLCGQ